MDIFAHTLWAGFGAKKLNRYLSKEAKSISIKWMAFWGVFPDLFAFTIPFLTSLFGLIQGKYQLSNLSHHGNPGEFELASTLYNYSHSLVIFVVVFLLAWVFLKRPQLALLGWTIHILLDIPTHQLSMYPTPFLWPISDYRFPYGLSWAEPWFMALNYLVLITIGLWYYRKRKSGSIKEN